MPWKPCACISFYSFSIYGLKEFKDNLNPGLMSKRFLVLIALIVENTISHVYVEWKGKSILRTFSLSVRYSSLILIQLNILVQPIFYRCVSENPYDPKRAHENSRIS